MPSPGGSGVDDLVDTVDPVVDAALAEPYESMAAYRSAIAEVRSAAAAYYSGPDLVMDDTTYDVLIARVAATEAAHPQWKADDSPTEVVAAGGGVVGDIEHSAPMLSLDNVFGEDALRRWAARLERLLGQPVGGFTVEPKIDGLAIAARYVDGRLTLVATRGDGRAGEDATGQARRAAGLPAQLREPLTYLAYAVHGLDDADRDPVPHSAAMGRLDGLGVATTAGSAAGMRLCPTIDEVIAAVEAVHAGRGALGFGVDGAVIKADQPADRERAGFSSRAPRWGVA